MEREKILKTRRDGFFLLPDACTLEEARVCIIPCGYERTTSYGKGTAHGPEALRKASHQVEFFDSWLGEESYKRFGIATMRSFSIPRDFKKAVETISSVARTLIREEKFIVGVGGEHTVTTLGFIKPIAERYASLAVVHFDAHADLRESFEGTPYSHACAMRRVFPLVEKIIPIGIRAYSRKENEFMEENKNKITPITARRAYKNWGASCRELEAALSGNPKVYITLDVDVLDPSVIGSSTGTPVPMGLLYGQILELCSRIAKHARVVGMDVVEFAPRRNQHGPNYTIAQLLYTLLGIIVPQSG